MEPLATERFQLGEWSVAPRLNSISHNGKTVRLEPKVMQVLVCLASAGGDVISKDDLIRRVWAGTFVTDDVLKRCIAELRKVFDDDPKNPSIIETIPRVGYRLVAPVELASAKPAPAPPRRHKKIYLAAGLVGLLAASLWIFKATTSSSSPRVSSFTTFAGFEGSPTFSPDGRQIAFDQVDEAGTRSDIFVQAIGDERAVKLTAPPGQSRCPSWSPDGNFIAYTRTWEADGTLAAMLTLMSPLGGSRRDLMSVAPRNNCTIAWSPDSRFLTYSNKPPTAAAGLFLLSTADGRTQRLTTAPEGAEDEDPAFSPDGSRLAFTRRLSLHTQDIYLVERDGTGLRRVTSLNANLGGPAWERDGQHLLFWSSASGSTWGSDLYRISAAGDVPQRLPFGGNDASHPAIARGANRLAYVKSTLDVNIWKISVSESLTPVKLNSSSRVDVSPAFAPDGQRIAFVSDRDGSLAIWTSDPDGSDARKIAGIQQGGSVRWSPDGQQICYDSRPDGHSHIYVVNPFSGESRQLTRGEYEDAVPSWSADGNWIYFTSTRNGPWNIWKVPSNGGEPIQVTRTRAVHPMESLDGRYLYYAKPADLSAANIILELPGIWRMPLAGGAEELVLALPDGPDGWYWTIAPKGIYFVATAKDSAAALKMFSFATRRVSLIAKLDKYPYGGPGLAVSPDGQTILYTKIDSQGSDIMLVDGYR